MQTDLLFLLEIFLEISEGASWVCLFVQSNVVTVDSGQMSVPTYTAKFYPVEELVYRDFPNLRK